MFSVSCLMVIFNVWTNVLYISTSLPPNIIFILLDDAGYSEFGFNEASLAKTPTIDNLATNEGLILLNYYVQPQCTPTRAAFITGRYPFRYGLHGDTISPCQPYGLPLTENNNLLPNLLKKYGNYDTYITGKWHLGYYRLEYTPIYRGFDEFYGYYTSMVDRFTFHRDKRFDQYSIHLEQIDKVHQKKSINSHTITNNDNLDVNTHNTIEYLYNNDGNYVDYVIGNYTLNNILINNYINKTYNLTNPFYISINYGGPHGPADAPMEQRLKYNNTIGLSYRGRYLGMMSAIDDSIGEIVNVLKADISNNNIYNNTLIIISSDNGGSQDLGHLNYPLRGGKWSLFEGGTKSPLIITGGYVNNKLYGLKLKNLMHVTDWSLTFLGLINNYYNNTCTSLTAADEEHLLCQDKIFNTTDIKNKYNLDGFDQSSILLPAEDINTNDNNNSSDMIISSNDFIYNSTRNSIFYNLQLYNVLEPCETKLLNTTICGAFRWNNWKIVIGNQVTLRWQKQRTKSSTSWKTWISDYQLDSSVLNEYNITYNFTKNLNCNISNQPNYDNIQNDCPYNNEACLYNLENDPCEYFDVKNKYPKIYNQISKTFVEYALSKDGKNNRISLEDRHIYDYDIPLCIPMFNLDDHYKPWLPWSWGFLFYAILIYGTILVLSYYCCKFLCNPCCFCFILIPIHIIIFVFIVDDNDNDLYINLNNDIISNIWLNK